MRARSMSQVAVNEFPKFLARVRGRSFEIQQKNVLSPEQQLSVASQVFSNYLTRILRIRDNQNLFDHFMQHLKNNDKKNDEDLYERLNKFLIYYDMMLNQAESAQHLFTAIMDGLEYLSPIADHNLKYFCNAALRQYQQSTKSKPSCSKRPFQLFQSHSPPKSTGYISPPKLDPAQQTFNLIKQKLSASLCDILEKDVSTHDIESLNTTADLLYKHLIQAVGVYYLHNDILSQQVKRTIEGIYLDLKRDYFQLKYLFDMTTKTREDVFLKKVPALSVQLPINQLYANIVRLEETEIKIVNDFILYNDLLHIITTHKRLLLTCADKVTEFNKTFGTNAMSEQDETSVESDTKRKVDNALLQPPKNRAVYCSLYRHDAASPLSGFQQDSNMASTLTQCRKIS